ncbi:major facilitator superfamily domain-containing protein [Mycena galericulata]|nr:major facilitator superfamily domain-containing protein [Mycena galericulata]
MSLASLAVAGAFLLQFCAVGPVMAFGVFQDFYINGFLNSYSASDISWIGSIQLFLGLGCGALTGKLYDLGHCRTVLVCGSAVFAFSFVMLSFTRPEQYYQVFLSQGLGMGIGISLIYVPTCTLVSQHFRARKALAMGILAASVPLGGVVFTIMLNQMIHHGPGFGWAVRSAAFLTIGCFVVANFLVTGVPPMAPNPRSSQTLVKSIANLPYSLMLLSGFVAQLGTFFPTFYLQAFARSHHLSTSLTFYAPVILNVSNILGRIIPNFFADRLGALGVYTACMGANGLVGFAMLASDHPSGLISFSIFFGFFFGSTIALYLPVVAVLVPRDADMGRIMGIALVPVGIASLIGPPIAGAILGPQLIWWRGIIFASVSPLQLFCLRISFDASIQQGRLGWGFPPVDFGSSYSSSQSLDIRSQISTMLGKMISLFGFIRCFSKTTVQASFRVWRTCEIF